MSDFRIEPWISQPPCEVCGKQATIQRINESKLGTDKYCSYFCDEHK